jgi:hypothetical protein
MMNADRKLLPLEHLPGAGPDLLAEEVASGLSAAILSFSV